MKTLRIIWIALNALCAPLSSPRAVAAETKPTVKLESAIFAGGCFWCMEAPFDQLPGVKEVLPGYTGGKKLNPTYEEVSSGSTGHAEAVRILFDPAVISYSKLLDVFWHQVDPTTENAQFCDHGSQYRSGIFYTTEQQKTEAEKSKQDLQKSGVFKSKLVTEITKAGEFYVAEEYHQQYYKKNPIRYRYYRNACGRDRYLESIWGKSAIGHK